MGVNNIPPKVCTYACVYCQLGRTLKMQVERRAFYEPDEIAQAVREKVDKAQEAGETVDYLTFVPDGEPTLDVNLGREIDLLRPLGIEIAVITNSSLLGRRDVRQDLMKADWVSLKMDAVAEEDTWLRVDRPHGKLRLVLILEGALEFAQSYEGTLVTETMLVQGVNDGEEQVRELADFLTRLQPDVAYLAIPTRPPAEPWVRPPGEEALHRAYQSLDGRLDRVEYLIGYEGNAFAFTGDAEEDLLSITAVHPMREDAVGEFLKRADADCSLVRELIDQGKLVEMSHEGHTFYMRKLRRGGFE